MKINKNDNLIEIIFDESVKSEKKQLTQAEKIKKEIEEIYSSDSKEFCILINISKPHLLIDSNSIKTVKVYKDILQMQQTKKMAILGKNNFADKVVSTILNNSNIKKANWFVTRQEALLWLSL